MKKEVFTNLNQQELTDIIRHSVRLELDNLNLGLSGGPNLMKIKEAKEYLQVSEATLFRWMKTGKIAGYHLGSRLFFKREELENALIKNDSKI